MCDNSVDNTDPNRLLVRLLGAAPPSHPVQFGAEPWRAILDLAAAHQLAPFLYRRLKDLDAILPSSIEQRLKDAYLSALLANTRFYHRGWQVVAALSAAGIETIPLKGAYLAPVVYGDPAVRASVDFDLLVRPADVEASYHVAARLGYRSSNPTVPLQMLHFHIPPMLKEGWPILEIHHHLAKDDVRAACMQEIWERDQEAMVEGIRCRMMAPEDLLLHLCHHCALQHSFTGGLRPLVDIAEVIKHHKRTIQWDVVLQRAAEWKMERVLFAALWTSTQMLGVDVPPAVLDPIKPDNEDAMMEQIRDQVLRPGYVPSRISADLARVWGESNGLNRLQAGWRAVFPSREWVARRYGLDPSSPRIWLYYPVRLRDVLNRYFPGVRALLRGDKATQQVTSEHARSNAIHDWLAVE
jgi:hypothetical protein